MRALAQRIVMLLGDRKAATAVEYGLILALVVLALMTGLQSLGGSTSSLWGNIHTKVQNAR
ncbi:MAG: Flp family type IVb pilin [Sphingomonas sp.]|uniref:Flp family type IVb pilin n=1 Tax=Sphingomonas sp. TaxID=28214 RepID=UPI0025F62A65|nr:Flp family type IVb pilin [Sphingomonas sp.]MBX3565170.1 Flp family type IVb pilin [Sphingomonas sp.]